MICSIVQSQSRLSHCWHQSPSRKPADKWIGLYNLSKMWNQIACRFGYIFVWLVVGPPLWKIWVSQLGWLETQYMGKFKKWQPNHQPVMHTYDPTPRSRFSTFQSWNWSNLLKPPPTDPAFSRCFCLPSWPHFGSARLDVDPLGQVAMSSHPTVLPPVHFTSLCWESQHSGEIPMLPGCITKDFTFLEVECVPFADWDPLFFSLNQQFLWLQTTNSCRFWGSPLGHSHLMALWPHHKEIRDAQRAEIRDVHARLFKGRIRPVMPCDSWFFSAGHEQIFCLVIVAYGSSCLLLDKPTHVWIVKSLTSSDLTCRPCRSAWSDTWAMHHHILFVCLKNHGEMIHSHMLYSLNNDVPSKNYGENISLACFDVD